MTKRYFPNIRRRIGQYDATVRLDINGVITTELLPVVHKTYMRKGYYCDAQWALSRRPASRFRLLKNAAIGCFD
jgi:hypothetical protein